MTKYNFSKDYNIIILRDNEYKLYQYYIEKNNYGDLHFIFGLKNKINPNEFDDLYIMKFIVDAERANFWGVEA